MLCLIHRQAHVVASLCCGADTLPLVSFDRDSNALQYRNVLILTLDAVLVYGSFVKLQGTRSIIF